jgi:LmbE family N-acetylglucosaminyl deacetylase
MIEKPARRKDTVAALAFEPGGALLSWGVERTKVNTTVLVAAHPDDEVLGAGSRLGELGKLTIVHVTDGAPRNMVDARRCGFSSREQYAQARRREMLAALAAGRVAARPIELKIPDQEASNHLPELARRLAATLRETKPDLVLTHAYEGGHPDHDACAFAVHAAARMMAPSEHVLWEFTSYHSTEGNLESGEFLGPDAGVVTVRLSPQEQIAKRRMLDCFRTQQEMLSYFSTSVERYRPAPAYDFTQPPHPGVVFLEQPGGGMTGSKFRELAARAIAQLGLGSAQ